MSTSATDAKKKQMIENKALQKQKEADLAKKIDYFKGTIIIIVIYGVVILIMSMAGIISQSGRSLLFEDGFTFTVTFISGTILVIIFLLIELYNYKPPPVIPIYSGDNMSCPDFWILKKTPNDVLAKIGDKTAKLLSKYYCQNPMNNTGVPMTVRASSATDRNNLGTNFNLPTQVNADSSVLKDLNTIL